MEPQNLDGIISIMELSCIAEDDRGTIVLSDDAKKSTRKVDQ